MRAVVDAMQREPEPVASYGELYEHFLNTGQHADVIYTLGERLVELAPEERLGYLIRGGLRFGNLTLPMDRDDLRHACRLSPDDPVAWNLLSIACLEHKEFDEALTAAKRFVSLCPDQDRAFEARARAHYHVKDFEACIGDCDEAIRLEPTNATCWAMRGEAKVAIGDKVGAKRDLDHAVDLALGDKFFTKLRDAALA